MGRELHIGAGRLQVHVDPDQTSGRLFVFESTLGPGRGMPYRHRHDQLEESFYVLDGVIDYTLGDETVRAHAGRSLTAPPGVVHNFVNAGTAVARQLVMITPGRPGLRLIEDMASIDFSDVQAVIDAHLRHASRLVDLPH